MKYNFKEFERDFPDDAACLEFIFWQRWPDGGKCFHALILYQSIFSATCRQGILAFFNGME